MTGPRRFQPGPLRRRDLALVAAVTLVELLGLRTGPPAPEPSAALAAVGLLLSLAQGLPLLWLRSHPWPVLLVVTAAFAAHALLLQPVPPYGAWVALFALAGRRELRPVAAATGLVVAACALAYLPADGPAEDAIVPALVAVALAVTAQLLRERRARVAAHAESAAVADRLRIARDLHDVLGHSLSGIAVQSSTGRLALEAGRTDLARDSLAAIEAASRESMQEVRSVLGMLRDAAGPGLDALDDLVATVSAGPLTVSVRRDGDLGGLPPEVSRAAYRVVQEALTNATRHAGRCHAQVSVRRRADRIDLEVLDDGRGSGAPAADGPGHGLVGMRERVTAAGGEVSAGPAPAGGWAVRAWLPLAEGEAP